MTKHVSQIVNQFARDAKEILGDNLVAEYLFGSYARGEETEYSDIDILLIVKEYDYRLRSKLSSLSSDYSLEKDVLISPVLTDLNAWRKNKRCETLLYQEIQKDGIKLC
jgi:predicted nucleotidyltransferase